MIKGLSQNDMIAIPHREERTEAKLEKALEEQKRLKTIIKELRAKLAETRQVPTKAKGKQ